MLTDVLSHYPTAVAEIRWVPLGSAGGFSGANVWRGESATSEPLFALKAWPAGFTSRRLCDIHRAMARAALSFVPAVGFTTATDTVVTHDGRCWDLTAWMPGTADFAANPSDDRLASAMGALAALHQVWRPALPQLAICPGVIRRMEVLGRIATSTFPISRSDDFACQATSLLPSFASRCVDALLPWANVTLPLQLCLRDIWHDHVLFTGDRVTGIIDYGAVAVDHPAVDLARLLGDFVGTNLDRIRLGVKMYHRAGGPAEIDARFVLTLANAGLAGSVFHWLERSGEGTPLGPAAERRFRNLIARLEACGAAGW